MEIAQDAKKRRITLIKMAPKCVQALLILVITRINSFKTNRKTLTSSKVLKILVRRVKVLTELQIT